MSLAGLKIVSFESRRADVVENLVRQQGGDCFNAPSVRERPIETDEECLRFVNNVIRGEYEAVLFTTGVGAQYVIEAAAAVGLKQPFLAALGRTKTVCRGPKPAAVLRPLGVPVALHVPEPNTWRETAEAMEVLPVKSIAIQEYGVTNPELIAAMGDRMLEETAIYGDLETVAAGIQERRQLGVDLPSISMPQGSLKDVERILGTLVS